MKKYQHFMEWLKSTRHFVGGESSLPSRRGYSYHKAPFSPESMVGLLVHSMLSSMPRTHFYTDGRSIYCFSSGYGGHVLTPTQQADIVKEDLVLEMIDAAPSNPLATYERTDGHLRVLDFSSSFRGRPDDNPYLQYLKEASNGVPCSLLRREEERKVRKIIHNGQNDITGLLDSLKRDEEPMPGVAERLERVLTKYGYAPSVPMVIF